MAGGDAAMTTWIFNNNTTKHRGVWHAVKGEIIYTIVPERVTHGTFSVAKYHARQCELYMHNREYDIWTPQGYRKPICSCKLATDKSYIIIGSCEETNIVPEHKTLARQPVLCHSTTISAWGIGFDSDVVGKREPGGHITATRKLEPIHTYEGDEPPPGPVCSRCVKKVQSGKA
jgi:hypothetical protein